MCPVRHRLTQRVETVATVGHEPEVGEHVARAKATHPRVCGNGYGALILTHTGDEARTRGGHA